MKAKKGDRVEIIGHLPGEPIGLPLGTQGTVKHVFNEGRGSEQYDITWDKSKSTLMLLPGDPFRVIA